MKCKRVIGLLLAVVMTLSVMSITILAEKEIKVLLDGEQLVFDVPPQMINSRTMVPMRKIFEAMGAAVEWDGTTQTVTATRGDERVIMQIDNKMITVNGENITLDVPPLLVDSRTLVPARAVAESFNAKVDWDGETGTVIITSPNKPIDDIYKYPNPTIDFSGDDGVMSNMHCELRLLFEQSALPEKLFGDSEKLKNLIVNDPENFLTYIDNEVWGICMNSVIFRYMSESEEEYFIIDEEDVYKYIIEIADKYCLHAYQNYEVDAVKIDDDKYMILLSMADIYDLLKVSEADKMLISNYVAIVYDESREQFGYYLLEKSLDGNYALCSINENMEHTIHLFVENNKKAFVENVVLLCNN